MMLFSMFCIENIKYVLEEQKTTKNMSLLIKIRKYGIMCEIKTRYFCLGFVAISKYTKL